MAIIPKVVGAKNINDFRLISLVGSIYKLISKLLAKRMSKVLQEVIRENQNAFVKGRQILDVVMVANVTVDDLLGRKKEGIICKIDMEKTYDHMYRDFVIYMLEMRRKWVKICISTTPFAVMVNGGPSSFFKPPRGLCQGDPISPILFLTITKAFSRFMERADELNMVRGLFVVVGDSTMKVSHLFFADDVLIFCEPDLSSLLHLRCILICFQLVFGLRINMKKT